MYSPIATIFSGTTLTISRNELAEISKQCGFSKIISLQKVSGGLLHELWHLRTMNGDYAIKRINQQNQLQLAKNLLSLRAIQKIEMYMQLHHIPTVVSLLPVNSTTKNTYVVMPWLEGQSLKNSEISIEMTRLIGKLLAQIHQINYTHQGNFPHWGEFSRQQWQHLIVNKNIAFDLSDLVDLSHQAEIANKKLNQTLIFSHRDLDPKNILWAGPEKLFLLDWEYAGLINPTLDLLIVALNFSHIEEGYIDEQKFQSVIQGYSQHLPIESLFDDIVDGYIGYCLDWIAFNLAINHAVEVEKSVTAIQWVQQNRSKLARKWL